MEAGAAHDEVTGLLDGKTIQPYKLRVNVCLQGEPAEWYQNWKARGFVGSVKDAVLMAFQAFQEKLTEQDLKRAQLKTLTSPGE